MFDLPMQFATDKLIVFEGLDDSGKSTQIERFTAACYRPAYGEAIWHPIPKFTHQPSGATGIGPDIYSLTEGVDWSKGSPLTRQLLHLSAHSEHYFHDILPVLGRRSVILDRCWWSTYSYGYRGEIAEAMTEAEWMRICQLPARGKMPDLVFLFTHRYGEKASAKATSSDRITFENYMELASQFPETTVIIPDKIEGEITAFISGELFRRGFVKTEEK